MARWSRCVAEWLFAEAIRLPSSTTAMKSAAGFSGSVSGQYVPSDCYPFCVSTIVIRFVRTPYVATVTLPPPELP